jgi:hypothetical protein
VNLSLLPSRDSVADSLPSVTLRIIVSDICD